MTRKIVHGNRNCGYAPIVTSGDTLTFGTPVMLPGMVSSSFELEQDESVIYADNTSWFKAKGAKVRSGEIALKYVSEDYLQFLGYKKNKNGVLTDTGKFPDHCIFFEETQEDSDGTTTSTLYVFYNVKGSQPAIETETDEEELASKDLTISYSASDSEFVVDDDGEYCQVGIFTRTDDNATLYDTFKQAVILPTATI